MEKAAPSPSSIGINKAKLEWRTHLSDRDHDVHGILMMTPHGMIDVCAARMSDDERRMQIEHSTRVVSK